MTSNGGIVMLGPFALPIESIGFENMFLDRELMTPGFPWNFSSTEVGTSEHFTCRDLGALAFELASHPFVLVNESLDKAVARLRARFCFLVAVQKQSHAAIRLELRDDALTQLRGIPRGRQDR